jgi:hypothetical protein
VTPLYPPLTKIHFRTGAALSRVPVIKIGYYVRPGWRGRHWIAVKRTKSAAGWWVPTEDIIGRVK